MKSLNDLQQSVITYQTEYRNPRQPVFAFSRLYDLFPERMESVARMAEFKWPQKWPFAEFAGVYAVLAEDLTVLYVGKASLRSNIGKRLSTHFVYDENKQCRPTGNWQTPLRYVLTVAVPMGTEFEAPALEEYLIRELDPPENMQGRVSTSEVD